MKSSRLCWGNPLLPQYLWWRVRLADVENSGDKVNQEDKISKDEHGYRHIPFDFRENICSSPVQVFVVLKKQIFGDQAVAARSRNR